MKQITSLWLLMFFFASTALFAQNASTGLANQAANAELDQFKVQQIEQQLTKTEAAEHRTQVLTDDLGDIVYTLDLETICGDNQLLGVEYVNGHFWVTGAGNSANPNYIYEVDPVAGTLVNSYEQPTTSTWGMRDLAWVEADGLLYAGDGDGFYSIDPTDGTIATVFSPTGMGVIRALAYDGTNFWTKSFGDALYEFAPDGTILNTYNPTVASATYGAAYDDSEGFLYLFSQDDAVFYQFDLAGTHTGVTYDVSAAQAGGISGGAFYDFGNLVPGYAVLGFALQGTPDIVAAMELYVTDVYANDVSISSILEPATGVDLTAAEPVTIKIKNNGTNAQSNIPYEVTWDGPTGAQTVSGTFAGTLEEGETADVTLTETADLSVYGDYTFEACTQLAGDEFPDNDCKTKTVTNVEPSLCVDNLYSTGCDFGDGLIAWSLENIDVPNIPCEGTPPWYHDYRDQVHNLPPGDYDLTVQAGYSSTFLDVWIDFNDDLLLTDDELVLDDAECADANTPYTFTITVPASADPGEHVMRFRTNWTSAVLDACETYSYGNCCDFSAMIGDPLQNDVGVASIDMATVYEPGTVTPMATVKNFGGDTQSFDVTLTIGSYSSTMSVSDLASGATEQVTFDDWAATEGSYTAEACTDLSGDENPDNDCKTLGINVQVGQFVYAYSAYDPSGALVEGPVTFDITNPGIINQLAPTTSTEFIAGACWAADTWWGAQYTGGLYTIDTETGDMVLVGIGPDLSGLAFDGTTVYGASVTDLYEIDPATGQGTMIGPLGNPEGLMIGIACNAAGDLYGYDIGDDIFYSIDKATGAATAVGALGFDFNYAQDMSFDKETDVCYLSGYTTAGGLFTVDVATGAATFIAEFQGGAEITGFAIPGGSTPPPQPFSEETFEDYNAGDYLMQQAVAQGKTYWSTWSAAPGTAEDPFVTNAQAFEGSNSVVIEGTNDAVLYLNDEDAFTEGIYDIDFMIYIPTGKLGYFNVLQLFDGASSEWGMQAYFDADGAGLVDAGGAGAGTFTYTYDTWHNVHMMIDLDADYAEMHLNGNMIVSWQWSTGSFGTGTLNELHAMNFYAWNEGGTPGAFFDNITLTSGGNPPVLDPPTEFAAAFVESVGVETSWVDPDLSTPGTWVGYDDGENVGGLGLNGGGSFWGAIRWEPADLVPFDGLYMTQFQFFPSLFSTEAELTFMIWEGADAGTLVYEQDLTDLEWNEFNTITLDEMHMVDATTELWIGFHVTHEDGEYPLGYDNGPAVAGYGDMVSFDGTTWESMAIAYSIDNNFNIQAFIADEVDGVVGDKQPLPMPVANATSTEFATHELKATEAPAGSRLDFQGINIYRDGALVNATPVAPGVEAYTDAFFQNGTYMYTAKAVYDEGLSEATPGEEVIIETGGGAEIEVSPASLTETHVVPPAQQTTQELTITNTGTEDLDWEIEINLNRGAQSNATPVDPEVYAQKLSERRAAEGFPISEAKTAKPTPSPNQTDEEVIRYDDGVNDDAIGLTSGGTFEVSAYWPASTMGQYAGMKLSQVEVYINDAPNPFVLKIYDAGTTTVPGALLHEETVSVTAMSWNVIELSSEVDISGDDIWIGYEVTHAGGEFPAGCDAGPAVAGFGDMISLDGVTFEPMSGLGLDYNWNIASTLIEGGPQPTNDIGVQAIASPNTGVELGSEPVTVTIKNYGTASQSNIPWEVTWSGAGSGTLSGTYAGPLASGETADIDAGSADLSIYGTYSFEACTNLAGDENANNDCKTKEVVNLEPSLCVDNLYSTGCDFGDGLISWDFSDVNVANIPCEGTPPWYHDYRDMEHTLEAGQTYTLTIQAGYSSTFVDVWIDFDGNLDLTDDELILNDAECADANTNYTFDVTIPANATDGSYVLRFRTNWLSIVEDACETYSYGNACDFTANVGGGGDWLSVDETNGTLGEGQSQTVMVTFDSEGLDLGVYEGDIVVNSNAVTNPSVDVPCTLNVTDEQLPVAIDVDPESLEELHIVPPAQLTTQEVTITNTGETDVLDWEIAVDLGKSNSQKMDAEEYARLIEQRQAVEGQPSADVQYGVTPGVQQTNGNHYSKFQGPNGERAVLYENGPFVTAEGVGSNGSDYSELQDASLGMGTYGFGCQISAGNSVADDFEVTVTWIVNEITFYAYQTGSGPPSTLTDLRVQIYDGDPSAGGSVIFGDLTTNVLSSTEWTNAWRVLESGPSENRPIMAAVADVTGLTLNPGIYWVEVQVGGTGASGPWMPPVTIVGETTTGNAIQNTGTWAPLVDVGPQGIPFMIEGNAGQQPDDDVSVSAIIEPVTGVELGNAEPITITLKNLGLDAQTSIPWEVTYDGPTGSETFSGTWTGNLASGETIDVTLSETADLSTFGDYEFEACTQLAGDEYPDNDCKEKTVTNVEPSLCVDNLYSTGCDFGDGLIAWSLENIDVPNIPCEGTPPWYHDYRDQVHELTANETYTLTVQAGYSSTNFDVWIDWNDDLLLSDDELVLDDAVCADANVTYTFDITIPASAPNGDHVLRFRTNWIDLVTDPCETYSYGNACDFTANIVDGGGGDDWLSVDETSGSLNPGESQVVEVAFNSEGLATGTYNGALIITSNAQNTPTLEVPATLVVQDDGPQPSIVFEPFEDYVAGDYLVQQAIAQGKEYWTTWSENPGSTEDPLVSDDQAFAGNNSVVIEGTNDAVLVLPENYTSGVFHIDFEIFIPTGKVGYFNALQLFNGTASEWGMQAYFDVGGVGSVDAGGAGAGAFTYTYDTWHHVYMLVDLDADNAEMYFNGDMIVQWQWSSGSFGTGTLNELHAMNFYAWAETGEPGAFFDNIDITSGDAPPVPDPPTNLLAVVDGHDVTLTWQAAGAFEPQWITYSAEAVSNSIGTNAAAIFDVAARWEPADLEEFENGAVTKINFVPGEPGDICTYTLKVWQGTTPPTLIYSQELTSITADVWNEVTLDNPVPFDNAEELWIGFNVNTTAGFPAGCDDGPQVEGYSNMMYWENAWVTLTSLNPDLIYNWAVQGYIEFAGDAEALLPMNEEPLVVENEGSLDVNPVKINPPAIFVPENTDAITYNVYRNIEGGSFSQIATEVSETTYVDMDLEDWTNYCYYVTAVNDEGGESDPSNEECVYIISVNELANSSFSIYPNPANNVVNIKSDLQMKSVKLMNLTGQIVYSSLINGSEFQINASEFTTGVYTLQIETESGTSIHKLIIQ